MALRIPGPKTDFDRMAQRYRVRQAAMAAKAALEVGTYWKGVEVGNEQSEANFVELSVRSLMNGYMATAEDSVDFVRETVGLEPELPLPNREQMARSMAYVGPLQARRALFGSGEEFGWSSVDARRHVQKQVQGAAVRLSALGGREVVRSSIDGRRVGYVRVTGPDPCAFCTMLAGRRAVYDEDSFEDSDPRFVGWGTVKVHDSCVIGSTQVAGPSVEAGTRRWYEGPLVVVRTASRKNLSITPNHPVLTENGWIPAGFLHEGHHVVSSPGVDGALRGAPDEGQHPVVIEDLLRTLLVVGRTLDVPGAAHQFHGDGTKAEVNVVAPDRLLTDGAQASLAQPSIQETLALTGAPGPAIALPGHSTLDHLRLTGHAPDAGLMGGGDGVGSLLGGHSLPAEPHSLAHASGLDIGLAQAPINGRARDAVALRDGLHGLAPLVGGGDLGGGRQGDSGLRFDPASFEFTGDGVGAYADLGSSLRERLVGTQVDLDRVVEVERVSFAGHVYNLQTSEGWYSADGVIVSNCQCALIPVTRMTQDQLTQMDYFEQLWKDLSGKDPKETDSSPLVTYRRNYRALRNAA